LLLRDRDESFCPIHLFLCIFGCDHLFDIIITFDPNPFGGNDGTMEFGGNELSKTYCNMHGTRQSQNYHRGTRVLLRLDFDRLYRAVLVDPVSCWNALTTKVHEKWALSFVKVSIGSEGNGNQDFSIEGKIRDKGRGSVNFGDVIETLVKGNENIDV
jgi:hypothetical protein